jgi:hypothetical protein
MGDPLFWVWVHPICKEKADQLLAAGVVSRREELIQCIACTTHALKSPGGDVEIKNTFLLLKVV